MAEPDFLQLSSVQGKTVAATATTSSSAILSNASSSNKLLKVGTVVAGNRLSSEVTITVVVNKNGSDFSVAHQVSVPGNATIVVLAKDTPIYLEENDSLKVQTNTNSQLDVVVSYEEFA